MTPSEKYVHDTALLVDNFDSLKLLYYIIFIYFYVKQKYFQKVEHFSLVL